MKGIDLIYISGILQIMSNKTLKVKAYEWLKDKIITLEYPMGSPLSEVELCRETGFGRTPVREAIQQLESEGLVYVRPKKGTFVSSVDIFDFEKLLESRVMLETYVVRQLAGAMPAGELERFRKMFDDVPRLVEALEIRELLKIERMFHGGLVCLLENQYLNAIADRTYDLVARTWYLSFKRRTQPSLEETLNDHLELLDALASGDAQAAEKMVVKHINDFKRRVFDHTAGIDDD